MPNASDRQAACETNPACLATGWLTAPGRSIRRWIDAAGRGSETSKPAKGRRRSTGPYRPPAWE